MLTYSFEKLDVWVEARKFVKWVYMVTASFPNDEKFELVLQLRRAAISIASNLEEGSGRTSSKDQAHFSHIAYGSSIEALTQLLLSTYLIFIDTLLLT